MVVVEGEDCRSSSGKAVDAIGTQRAFFVKTVSVQK